jgi:putative SOS response-associated peptidase YedK
MHTDEMGIVSCLSAEILFRNCVRDDKLATTWRRQFKHRCLIPAELFYEWEVLAPEEKEEENVEAAGGLSHGRLALFIRRRVGFVI